MEEKSENCLSIAHVMVDGTKGEQISTGVALNHICVFYTNNFNI
jgi:hypothetical protein